MDMEERTLTIPAGHELNVFGQFDANVKKVERALHVTVLSRDGSIRILGESAANADRAGRIFESLAELSLRGNTITDQNVDYAISLAMEKDDPKAMVEMDSDIICHTVNGKPVKPKTLGQKEYVDAIRKNMIVFGIGPAGTSRPTSPWRWRSPPSKMMR